MSMVILAQPVVIIYEYQSRLYRNGAYGKTNAEMLWPDNTTATEKNANVCLNFSKEL